VVVDDGSDASTAAVCRALARHMPLRLITTTEDGQGKAKNVGIAAARAPVVVFFDDDVAHPDFLWHYVSLHSRDMRERIAITGRVAWSPELQQTPLMQYLTDSCSSGSLRCASRTGEGIRPFGFLLGAGAASWKTEFLRRHGLFDEAFTHVLEDLELAHRLSRYGLVISDHHDAVSYRARPFTLEDACWGAEHHGRALVRLALRHTDRQVLDHCRLEQWSASWWDVRYRVRKLFRHARRLERDAAASGLDQGLAAIYDELLAGMTGRGVSKEMGQLPKSDAARLQDSMGGVVDEPAKNEGNDGTARSPVLSTHE
jgi:cellulose synthase/poly-beta-1,6-N-acetylglucosamine synthase-like glycosyltransferase